MITTRIVSGRKVHEEANPREEQSGYIDRWIECDCGEEVALDGFTNTCEGGADYNAQAHT
jgi:hypothetical protein